MVASPPGLPGDPVAGEARIAWAGGQMPVLRQVRERLARERPLEGVRIAACLHVTAETANLVLALLAGGAEVGLCPANPLTTQDEVVAALADHPGAVVLGHRGESPRALAGHMATLVAAHPHVTIDDGADLVIAVHAAGGPGLEALRGGTEETTTGLVRLRALAAEGGLHRPVLAVNESFTERAFNDRYGTGQSALDGILRSTNLLLAGRTLVVLGYGPAGQGVAQRARGAGAIVVVCEVEPLRALEAAMEGYTVLPALRAAAIGDVFVTVTGGRGALSTEHFRAMKDGAVLANAGHFDVEIDLPALEAAAVGGRRDVLPLVEEYDLGDRRLNLLARGRVVNLAAAQGHPAAVMDMSFAGQALAVVHLIREGEALPAGVIAVPPGIDREVARLKLESLGVEIDRLSEVQREYLRRWEG